MKNRPLILGVAAAAITIAIGVGIVLAVTRGDNNANGTAGPSTTHSRSSTTTSGKGSTTTSTKPSSASTAPATTRTTAPTPAPTQTDTPDIVPEDAYQTVPLPGGLSATIGSCGWSAANGGQLQASGTITNVSNQIDVWSIDVIWLVRNGPQDEELDSNGDVLDLAPGESLPWNYSIGAPTPPPNLSCALEVG